MNIQCLRNKLGQLELFLNIYKWHVLCLSEHWLNESEIMLYIPYGYDLASSFCRPGKYGGTAIYVKQGILYEVIDPQEFSTISVFEVAIILLRDLHLIVISVYSTPNSDKTLFTSPLERLVIWLEWKYECNILICGDFNLDITKNSHISGLFQNTLRSLNLFCLNYSNTRKQSCLDNIATNISKEVMQHGIHDPNLSDHAGIWIKICTDSSLIL